MKVVICTRDSTKVLKASLSLSLMIFCLHTTYVILTHHWKNNAQNDRSDSTLRILTLVLPTLLRWMTADLLNFVINFAEKERAFADIWTVYVKNLAEMPQKSHNECLRICISLTNHHCSMHYIMIA